MNVTMEDEFLLDTENLTRPAVQVVISLDENNANGLYEAVELIDKVKSYLEKLFNHPDAPYYPTIQDIVMNLDSGFATIYLRDNTPQPYIPPVPKP